MAVMGKSHSTINLLKIYLVQKVFFLIRKITNLILCDNYLLPSRLSMGKVL